MLHFFSLFYVLFIFTQIIRKTYCLIESSKLLLVHYSFSLSPQMHCFYLTKFLMLTAFRNYVNIYANCKKNVNYSFIFLSQNALFPHDKRVQLWKYNYRKHIRLLICSFTVWGPKIGGLNNRTSLNNRTNLNNTASRNIEWRSK